MRYFALLDGSAGAYGISFPDCPGCTAMGETVDETVANAVAALSEWLDDAGEARTAPSEFDAFRALPEVIEAMAEGTSIVPVPALFESEQPVKANVSLNRGLLEAIDEAARRANLTRSGFIAAAAREKIGSLY